EYATARLHRHFAHDLRRPVDVRYGKAYTGSTATETIEERRVFDVDEGEAPVELVHPDAIETRDRKALCSRQDSRRGHDALRQCHGYLVTDRCLQFIGELNTEDYVESSRREARQVSFG